jgi:hypothetical protein
MDRGDALWTGKWIADRIRDRSEIENVQSIAPQILQVLRKEEKPFIVGTLASERVNAAHIASLASGGHPIEIFVNIPKESCWGGDAIAAAKEVGASFGGMSDLHRVITVPDPGAYVNPEFQFVERGLRQHTRVSGLERLFDRKFQIQRRGLEPLTVVLLNEYELTADHVRTARDRYGVFDAVLITNPNGGATGAALEASESMGSEIFMWGEFLGRLNRK